MKLFRNAVILIVVFGVLFGAYYFLSHKKTKENDAALETGQSAIKVMSVEKEDITSVEYNNPNGKFTIKFDGKNWTIDPAFEFKIKYNNANSAAIDMSTIVADKVIEENAADLSKYGLDKPSSVTVTLKNGTKKTIEVGSKTPTNDGIYVKMQGESKVYMVGEYYLDKLTLTKGKLIETQLLPVEASTISNYKISKNGNVVFALNTKDQQDIDITEPVTEKAEANKVTPVFQGIVGLNIVDIADENPTDLAKYGLDKPAYTLEYGTTQSSIKLEIGKDVEKDKTAYAKFAGGKAVFTLDTTPLTFLDLTLDNIVSSFVFLPNIQDVNKIELNIDNKNIVCDISHSADKKDETFKVNGKDANMKNAGGDSLFRKLYAGMVGIIMNRYEPNAKPTGTPEVSIKYYMNDSKVVTVGLISKDNNYYYAMKDGVYTSRVILKSKFDEPDGLRTTLNDLLKELK